MPLSSIGSYLVTAQQIIAHWTQVNAALGATPLVLKGSYTLANFTTDRAALQTTITVLEPVENALQTAVADRDIRKAAIKPRVLQFRNSVRHFLISTPYENALPDQPALSATASRFLKPLDDVSNLWTTVNAIPAAGAGSIPGFTPPLTLFGVYTLALFNTELASLRTSYLTVTNTQKNAQIARERRNALLLPLKTRMMQYRRAVLALFPATEALVLSLPVVSVPSGSTPDPVSVSGVWNTLLNKAVLTIVPSTDVRLDYYSVRTAPLPAYRAADETTIGRIEKGQTTFETLNSLAASGSTALFRIYVVTTTGHEKGSSNIKIVRP